ncbi:M16 family metallopeptidase [Amycolatopsis lurida]
MTLRSGLRVVIEPDHRRDLVAVGLTVGSGSRDDPPGTRGLAHLVEHLMLRRGQGRPGAVEAVGGRCGATTFRDHTSYFSVVGGDQLGPLLTAEAARLVRFEADQRALDDELPVIEEEIREAAFASSGGFPWTMAASALWGPDRHAGGDHGIMAQLRGLTPADATAFQRKHYAAGNLVLSIVGAVEPARAEATVREAFGELTRGRRPPWPSLTSRPGAWSMRADEHFRGTALAIATQLPDAATDPAGYLAHGVLAEVLSAARLPRWRESRSWLRSATIRCGYHGEWLHTASPDLLVTTFRRERNWPVKDVLADWEALVSLVSSTGPEQGELRRAVAILRSGQYRQLDSPLGRAVAHGRFTVLFPDWADPHQVPGLLATMTAERVAAAAAAVRAAPTAWVEVVGDSR